MRRRGDGDPFRHVTLNVALYGQTRRWAMTERGARWLERGRDHLALGPSSLRWENGALVIDIDEVTAPIPRRVRGRVRVLPSAVEHTVHGLDRNGRHRWRPIAPCARVEVALARPGLSWSGEAYLDTNDGDVPLEADFVRWNWSRAPVPGGSTILYESERRDGSTGLLALRYAAAGGVEAIAPPAPVALPRTLWRVARATRADEGKAAVAETLEDTPFYSRSVLRTRLLGGEATAVHESLDLDRLRSPVVQAMLPFKMPRRG